jgi:hypothetical protein
MPPFSLIAAASARQNSIEYYNTFDRPLFDPFSHRDQAALPETKFIVKGFKPGRERLGD